MSQPRVITSGILSCSPFKLSMQSSSKVHMVSIVYEQHKTWQLVLSLNIAAMTIDFRKSVEPTLKGRCHLPSSLVSHCVEYTCTYIHCREQKTSLLLISIKHKRCYDHMAGEWYHKEYICRGYLKLSGQRNINDEALWQINTILFCGLVPLYTHNLYLYNYIKPLDEMQFISSLHFIAFWIWNNLEQWPNKKTNLFENCNCILSRSGIIRFYALTSIKSVTDNTCRTFCSQQHHQMQSLRLI